MSNATESLASGDRTQVLPANGALSALALSMLLSALGTSSANVALPTLVRAFAASFAEVQWVVLAYLLAITILIVGVGRLADRVGRRRLLLAGLVLFALASAACGLAPSLTGLIVARAAQGIAAATMMALTLAFVGEIVPKDRAGSSMGLLGTMSAVGTALGPSLGGVLIDVFGWRAIFFVNVPLALLALFFAARFLPVDRTGASDGQFDYAGTLLLALTLAAYALALTSGREHLTALAIAAVTGFALFVFVELRSASPLLAPAIFRQRVFAVGFATSSIVATVLMATLVVGPFYLAHALGLAPARVGLIMSVGPAVAALAGFPAGRAVDRFGAPKMSVLSLAGVGLGSVLLALLPMRLGLAAYIGPLVVVTAAYALFQTANNTSVMAAAEAGERGLIAAMLGLSRNLGLISGAALMGTVFALGTGGEVATATPAAVAAGMRLSFAVAAALLAFALVLAMRSAAVAAR